MLRLQLLLFLVAVLPSLRFPFLPACATQGAADVSASFAPFGGPAQKVEQYITIEEDATLLLIGSDLHYVAVAPRRYVEMVSRALQGDLTGCFCRPYPPKHQSPSARANSAASLDMTGGMDGCSITHLAVVSWFNGDPQQVAANFTWSLMIPFPDGGGRPTVVPPGTAVKLPNNCFTELHDVLEGLTRRPGRRSLQQRTVYFGMPLSDPTRKRSSGLFGEASFTNIPFWMALGVLVVSGLMVLVTVLFTSWRVTDGMEELGPTGVASNVVIPDSTRYGPWNNSRGDTEGKELGSSWRKGGAGRRPSNVLSFLRW
ncbi:hypothetical protein TraAM80_03335 [Trypanosoma rangeli]|uniref:Uncharacterized protein n=1 Tax=Trypanosoma rangeli TaxID=5698 RepID=A0A3R7MKB6_TRYRA|nr:uncharacterized protein TraAM80_03335 [Trypanosoma rangeli]RNF07366.1 hypothetical protein TraAM80_03335 [Trypanosoma rangeli]|eukprot:RNF07366.1 hypothetical protein TraAM80_03335 [Trypanosoma rangeli]